jgi:plastocyanin/FtsP/CotA-like multicopper oxidase with cupredoxin domain
LATIEYWIRIENRPWDMSPHNIDRMNGQNMQQITGKPPATVTLNSVVPGTPPRNVTMFNPIRNDNGNVTDALILRRYLPPQKADKSDAWTVPDDRKVNPWDLNEHNPGETGTMGTIPGPVVECNVGDRVIVHFKNGDGRVGASVLTRTHSLHPHGFVFKPTSDGAYPLSPPDSAQPTSAEAPLWASIGVTGQFKQGDRVPPGGTFDYTWETFGWQTTAGVWLYHDHSICDMDNVELGAIGIVVIHNPQDTNNEVDIRNVTDPTKLDPAFLPGGSAAGAPTQLICQPLPVPMPLPAGQLIGIGAITDPMHGHDPGVDAHDVARSVTTPPVAVTPRPVAPIAGGVTPAAPSGGSPLNEKLGVKINNQIFEVDPGLTQIIRFCLNHYRTPPAKELILQLYHTIRNGPTCINGRQWLGNTPTIISGPTTKMRFGVVGMGSMFHTFHLHGHRWILPGPDGNNPGNIMTSAQVTPVSQFEDTRTFGPANSLVFTINPVAAPAPGSFMRAGGPLADDDLGEWHMHCHVLNHMMVGMMGSLLIVKGGELAGALPVGVPCPASGGGTGTQTTEVHLTTNATFSPKDIMINAGDTVTWKWDDATQHSVTSDTGAWVDSGVRGGGPPFPTFQVTFNTPGLFKYHCQIHGAPNGIGMSGSVMVM